MMHPCSRLFLLTADYTAPEWVDLLWGAAYAKIGGPAIFAFYRWRVEEIVHLTSEEFHNCQIGEPIL